MQCIEKQHNLTLKALILQRRGGLDVQVQVKNDSFTVYVLQMRDDTPVELKDTDGDELEVLSQVHKQ